MRGHAEINGRDKDPVPRHGAVHGIIVGAVPNAPAASMTFHDGWKGAVALWTEQPHLESRIPVGEKICLFNDDI
jgi:hypothetical protein